jgi:SET domain-containing protein
MLKPYLFIDQTATMGRGVFTNEPIAADTFVEESPVIIMSREDKPHLDKTLLHDYIFEWGPNQDKCCMALGLIPIYNHSYNSNCEYYMDYEEDTIAVKTVRLVEKGEELTINYNGDCNDQTAIWFDAK